MKVIAHVTITKEFESEDPANADFFAKDFAERLRFTVPHEKMDVVFSSTPTKAEVEAANSLYWEPLNAPE